MRQKRVWMLRLLFLWRMQVRVRVRMRRMRQVRSQALGQARQTRMQTRAESVFQMSLAQRSQQARASARLTRQQRSRARWASQALCPQARARRFPPVSFWCGCARVSWPFSRLGDWSCPWLWEKIMLCFQLSSWLADEIRVGHLGCVFVNAGPLNPKISHAKPVERNCYFNVPKKLFSGASPNFSAKQILEICAQ
jgi:hypothetical protein